ncbi:hypothetical protein K1719_025515, partial [Acacia pycnantha]
MLTNDTNVEVLLLGYPKDFVICPKLSMAIKVPLILKVEAANRSSMSTLNKACNMILVMADLIPSLEMELRHDHHFRSISTNLGLWLSRGTIPPRKLQEGRKQEQNHEAIQHIVSPRKVEIVLYDDQYHKELDKAKLPAGITAMTSRERRRGTTPAGDHLVADASGSSGGATTSNRSHQMSPRKWAHMVGDVLPQNHNTTVDGGITIRKDRHLPLTPRNMFSCIAISIASTSSTFPFAIKFNKFHHRLRQPLAASPSSIHYDSLRVLEWDKLCDLVASFATTSLGREAVKVQLWSLNQTYDNSLRLLKETNVAVEMHKHGGCRLDFGHIDAALVESAIQNARRNRPVNGFEALAIVALLQLAETLQVNLKSAIKEDIVWYSRFMPLTEVIVDFVINPSLVRMIEQVIDENGSVKDSASPALKQSREQVLSLERKIHRLMESLVRNERSETSILEVNSIDGRWCIRVDSGQRTSLRGLLLSSGSGGGSIVEPLSAVPLNDELQQARALMAKAEADVLFR